jgi:4-hydroxybenzoate polyprenyltransferase
MKASLEFFLKFYRVSDWIKVLGLVLIPCILFKASITDTLKLIFITSLLLAYGFSINDFFDFKLRGEKNLVAEMYKKKKHTTLLMLILPPLLSLYFSFFIFSMSFSLLLFLLAFIICYVYSAPQVRLRDRKILDILSNSMFILIFCYSYFYFTQSISLIFLFFLILYINYFLVSEIIHELSHWKRDKSSGRVSTVIWLGEEASLAFAKLIIISGIIVSLIFYFFFSSYFKILPIVSILFSFFRLMRIKSWKYPFYKLRTKIFGSEEGILYIILLFLFNYFS